MHRQFEPRSRRRGQLVGDGQGLLPVGPGGPQVDPQMTGCQAGECRREIAAGRLGVRPEADTHGRERAGSRRQIGGQQVDHRPRRPGHRRGERRRPLGEDLDGLFDPRSGGHRERKRQGQRTAVGLERGVGPVPLVLHLEGVSRKPHRHPEIRRGLGGDGPDVAERLPRRDERRERAALHRAIDVFDAARPARHAGERMEHAEADPVALEGLGRRAGEVVRDPALRITSEAALPGEVDAGGPAVGGERDREAVGGDVDGQIADERLDGVPVAVAHGRIDATNDLPAVDPHPPEEPAPRIEFGRERTGPQGEPCRRFGGGMAASWIGPLTHRAPPPRGRPTRSRRK